MNWRCWFGHKWKVLNYKNRDIDIKIHYRFVTKPSFVLHYICTRCKKLKIKTFLGAGHLTNEQFYEIWETTNVE